MKRKMWFLPITIGVILFTLTTACKKDKDDDNTPTPNPITTESRDKFIGNYNINDTLYNPTPDLYWYASYVMVISEYPNDTAKISISNINNSGNNITASVSGSIFTVSSQPYGSGGVTIHGTGNISNNKLRFNLTTGGVGDQTEIYGSGIKF
jgi:hypothetical protein